MMRVGCLGGGQLGMMLAEAGKTIRVESILYDETPEACGGEVTQLVVGKFTDEFALTQFSKQADIFTYEFENVPTIAVETISKTKPVFPGISALQISQDRLSEKFLFKELEIPTAEFFQIDSEIELKSAIESTGIPAVLKTRRMGYDGKGQVIIQIDDNPTEKLNELGGKNLILESFVPFEREVSQISVRNNKGNILHYPLVENVHEKGILRTSIAPAPNSEQISIQSQKFAKNVLEKLNYVGVLTIEFFEKDGQLIANEMAPRVHNSGHWTIEGAKTSQFENHLRAITGMPLGPTDAIGNCEMINFIGEIPDPIPDGFVHLYGKEPRPGRKLGHVTRVSPV